MSLHYSLLSDTGRERDNNEDFALALPEIGLFVIADGMGGHIAGEVASRVAVETLTAIVKERPQPRRIKDEAELLGEAMIAAHEAVLRAAEERGLFGMGTTLTALRIHGNTAVLAHVGDTRAYFAREAGLETLTRDHTLVAMLVEGGSVSEAEAMNHPDKHLLTQAIGTQAEIESTFSERRIPKGARILLSTDGLHDVVPPERILELALTPDLDAATAALIDSANEAGGPDNVSVILIQA
jgi:protein phosphatase